MTRYTYTLTIDVTDPEALIHEAQLIAMAGGEVDPDEIQTVEQALGWLFDNKPSPEGASIIDSIAEAQPEEQGACILTAENMHTADDCTMHDHEPA